MLYEIDKSYIQIRTVIAACIFFILFIVYVFVIRNIKKDHEFTSHISTCSMGKIIFVILMIIVGLYSCFTFGENAYCVYLYKTRTYSTVEGTVRDFQYLYANNSNVINGIEFKIEDEEFYIHNGLSNVGYSADKKIITKNGDRYKIYYVDNHDNTPIRTILRIDSSGE